MKREDFSFTANKGGYMLSFKGKPIGGAGTLSKGMNLRGRAIAKQIKDYHEIAERDIESILSGRIRPDIQKAIDQINVEEAKGKEEYFSIMPYPE